MKLIKKSLFAFAAAGALCMGFLACTTDAGGNTPVNPNKPGNTEEKVFPKEPSVACPDGEGIVVTFADANVMDKGCISSGPSYSNGEVTYTTTAQYSGGGCIFYIKPDQSVVNLTNYDSIYVDFEYEAGTWKTGAKAPQWCLNVYPEGAGFWNGGKTLQYFSDEKMYGRTTINHKIAETDTVVAVGIKLNAYNTNNADNDNCRVTIKKIKFVRKDGKTAADDKPEDDGLTDAQRGAVKKITYQSKDYQEGGQNVTNKSAYIYLPAGFDQNDKAKKYPVVYLMHGQGGNESEWGMTKDNARIKKYMDKQIAEGKVKPFIIVCPNGRSSADFANTQTNDQSKNNYQGFYKFGSELRNDLIPFMEENYNASSDRNDRGMAGLSMGGMQTINIGMCESLDLISWFGAFSAAPTSYEKAKVNEIITGEKFAAYEINYFYNYCATDDNIAYTSFGHRGAVEGLDEICSKLTADKNFTWKTASSGGHSFTIWYPGFEEFATIAFQKK